MINSKQTISYFFITGLFFSFTIFVFAPFELYLLNINNFSFDLGLFWQIPLYMGIMSAIFVIGIGFIVNLLFKHTIVILYGTFLFAIGLACYIQGNFIGLKVGILNGAQINWNEYASKAFFNLFIWIAVILLVLSLLYFKKTTIKIIKIISGILIGMQAVALIVLFITTDYKQTSRDKIVTDEGLFEVSSERNVIIFVLDMFDDTYFKSLLAYDPDIAKNFTGFTHFTNSVGSANTTDYSYGAIFSGRYMLNNGVNYYDMLNKTYDQTDFFDILKNNNYRLDTYLTPLYIPEGLKNIMFNYKDIQKAYISNNKILIKYLYKLVLCKYAPDVFKPFVWLYGSEFDDIIKYKTDGSLNSFSSNNSVFVSALRSNSLMVNSKTKIFKLIHLDGVHYPYYIDENANPAALSNDESDALKAAKGSLKIVSEYLEKMEDLNVYDQSTVIICADHGYYWDGVLTNPVLLVKRAGDSGEFQKNDAPVCHLDFHATIMEDLGLNQDHKYGKSIFEIKVGEPRNRMFYQYYLQEGQLILRRLIEFSVADESNLRKSFKLTDKEYSINGEIIPHRINCGYCLSGAYDSEDPDTPGNARLVHYKK